MSGCGHLTTGLSAVDVDVAVTGRGNDGRCDDGSVGILRGRVGGGYTAGGDGAQRHRVLCCVVDGGEKCMERQCLKSRTAEHWTSMSTYGCKMYRWHYSANEKRLPGNRCGSRRKTIPICRGPAVGPRWWESIGSASWGSSWRLSRRSDAPAQNSSWNIECRLREVAETAYWNRHCYCLHGYEGPSEIIDTPLAF